MTLYYETPMDRLFQGDAKAMPFEDQSVHCVVTSPPYFGLRQYHDVDDRVLGMESTPALYVQHMVRVFREVKRVLRDDGVCWVNLGDSYSNDPGNGRGGGKQVGGGEPHRSASNKTNAAPAGNQLLIPHQVAMALQADGWILRSTIVWAKKSAMPESLAGWRWEQCRVKVEDDYHHDIQTSGQRNGAPVNALHSDVVRGVSQSHTTEYTSCPGCAKCTPSDGLVLRRGSWRCTSAHEYIFMFCKSMGYYADGEAVKTALLTDPALLKARVEAGKKQMRPGDGASIDTSWGNTPSYEPTGANRRNVWRDISPEPYPGKHFATFPSDLPRICIQASTSEAGVCPKCGSQWARVVEVTKEWQAIRDKAGQNWYASKDRDGYSATKPSGLGLVPQERTLSWRPTCACNAGDPTPATVLDPFAGTATTLLAAQRLGRYGLGMELSPDYLEQAKKRLEGLTLPLLGGA